MLPNLTKTASLGLMCAAVLSASTASAQLLGLSEDRTNNSYCPAISDWTANVLFSTTDHTNWASISTLPRKKVFVDPANRAGMVQKRIVMFGDLGAMDNDQTPRIDKELRDLFASADLVLGNVEAPITSASAPVTTGPDATQWQNFHASTFYLKSFMAQHCIDPQKAVFTVANNHADDHSHWVDTLSNVCTTSTSSPVAGAECVSSNLDGARFIGIDTAPYQDAAIRQVDLQGMRVGLVGWTHVQNTRPKRDFWGKVLPVTWEGSLDVVGRDFKARKAQLNLKMLIGMPHWGCQFNDYPHAETVANANALADSGFDLIAGAHPSVLQPANMVGANGNTLAFFSMGGLGTPLLKPNPVQTMVVFEVLVNTQGQLLQYELHRYVARNVDPATTFLSSPVDCTGGLNPTDTVRATSREIVPYAKAWLDALGASDTPTINALIKDSNALDKLFPQF